MKYTFLGRYLFVVAILGGAFVLPWVACAAPLTYIAPTTISLISPATTLTIASGSMADVLQVNATSVLVTLSGTTGGSFSLTAASPYDLSIASSTAGGTVSLSCAVGTASTTISQGTGSVKYTITPVAPECLFVSNVAASTTAMTATVTWTTDNAASSEVDYGPTTAYGSVATSGTLATTHSIRRDYTPRCMLGITMEIQRAPQANRGALCRGQGTDRYERPLPTECIVSDSTGMWISPWRAEVKVVQRFRAK
ncbi:MAG: hypothetical protein ACLQPN_11100 [Bryobacteraceae bacterium]